MLGLILISPCFISLWQMASHLPQRKPDTTKNKVTAQAPNPILFLHGWMRNGGDFNTMMDRFKADGWPETILYAKDFDNSFTLCPAQPNIDNANKIKQWVDEILDETEAEKIDLVGHSMGGVSSRYYIKFLGGNDTVDDYVSLGSPHHGVKIENDPCGNESLNALTWILNEGDETPSGLLNDTLGIRYDPISSNVAFNGSHVPGSVNYTSIYSTTDLIVPWESAELDGAHNISVSGIGHLQLLEDDYVYELVKAAVDDTLPTTTTPTTTTPTTTTPTTTTPTTTTPTTTTPTTTTETAQVTLGFILAVLLPMFVIVIKRLLTKPEKRRKSS